MKNFLLLLSLLCTLNVTAQKKQAHSFYFPRPKTYTPVNDYAGIFTKEEAGLLAEKIRQYRDTTSNVIVIITQRTLYDSVTDEHYQLEETALHYFNNWGIGDKEKNNGVLIFIVKNDRKVRITTGKGIEDILTNDDCSNIIDNWVVPQFKLKEYFKGTDEVVDQVMQILSPELFEAPAAANEVPISKDRQSSTIVSTETEQPDSNIWAKAIIAIAGVILLLMIAIRILAGPKPTVIDSTSADTAATPKRGLLWIIGTILFSLGNSFSNSNRRYRRYQNTSYNNNFYDQTSSGNYHHSSDGFGSSSSGFSSSSSDFSSSSSSDSSSGSSSFGGGSSDGGGASGSW